ncbi:unnamed protein product [Pleuronectes platessa]|uniref:Uncharacterized protein n=1 Tax=Pleuronectes platessa TaxID=8262 RepID=A0A9N7YMY1_PLEPL|nr:unnamed protein product [Pleuronectes platessa]
MTGSAVSVSSLWMTLVRISPTGTQIRGHLGLFPAAPRAAFFRELQQSGAAGPRCRRGLEAEAVRWLSVMTDGDDGHHPHPEAVLFVLHGEMRQGVERRNGDAGLRPNIAAY